ncbi:phage major capsid protein [Streptosporangium jomthongense]|uniref:Phage major capsid protein n=1 Tax=Streptosporangium jomthongense TaxID=1193683 RepID=A0ABV8FHS2_9ACTN
MTIEAPERVVEFPALKEAQQALDAKRQSLKSIFDEAGADYDMAKVKSIQGDTAAKVDFIRQLNAEIDERKAKVDELLVIARAAGAAKEAEQVESGHKDTLTKPRTKNGQHRSLGELFVASQACKGYRPGSGMGPSAQLDIELKTLFQTSGGWAPESIRTGRVEMFPTRPAPHVVEFLPQTTTTQASVVYMEETTFTNAAAETAEGGSYPEATLALTERASQVRKVAVFLPITDEQFEDEPRAEMYVQNRLPFMLRQRLDGQILVGDGTGVNLLGTASVVGIQTQAKGADPTPDAIYKLFRKIRDDGFAEPSVLFIRPAKWEEVRLLKTSDGVYIWGHPSIPGPSTIWGVPVVETVAAPATSAVAGDYANFSELAVRRGIDVQVSNSHSTYFAEGKLALRADVRCTVIHYRPKAFGTVTGL